MTVAPKLEGSKIVRFSGTSAAVPFVTSLVAVLMEKNPALNPSDIIKIVLNSADDINCIKNSKSYKIKVINYYKAVGLYNN